MNLVVSLMPTKSSFTTIVGPKQYKLTFFSYVSSTARYAHKFLFYASSHAQVLGVIDVYMLCVIDISWCLFK